MIFWEGICVARAYLLQGDSSDPGGGSGVGLSLSLPVFHLCLG